MSLESAGQYMGPISRTLHVPPRPAPTQSLATGLGIILNLVTLVLNIVFASIAGGKYRNKAFFVGIIISVIAMIAMAMGGANLWVIVGATAFMKPRLSGSPARHCTRCGPRNPSRLRSVLRAGLYQRLLSSVLRPVRTDHPGLVLPETIQTTMWCFAAIVVVEGIAGTVMIRAQKKYGTDEERQFAKANA